MIRKQSVFDQINKNMANDQSKQTHQQLNFIQKAYELVNNSKNSEIIHWSKSGLTFIIQDIEKFQRELLPLYFRHNRYQSFVRQLNMYDFHKIRNGDYYCDNKSEFRHDQFCKGNMQSIYQIKRKGFQARNKQKENTKIKKSHKINTKKNLRKRKLNIAKQPVQKKIVQPMYDENENSFFIDLPVSRQHFASCFNLQNKQKMLQKIAQKVIEQLTIKNSMQVMLKRNKLNQTIEIAQLIKDKWIQQFQKISGSEDIRYMKDIYNKVKQQLSRKSFSNNYSSVQKQKQRLKAKQNQNQIKKVEQGHLFKNEQFQLLHIVQQQDAIIESIFRAEIKSTLICITSQTFLNNGQFNRKFDTLMGI